MRQRSFINLVLTFLWGVAGICGFLVISWQAHLTWIDHLHEWVTQRILLEPTERYEKIVAQLRMDKDQHKAIVDLEILAGNLASVQKNDVLDPTKRSVFTQLVWLYQQQHDIENAARWATYWRSWDPWDLNAQIEWAGIMMTSADTYAAGKSTFVGLVDRFPELLGLATSYARALAKSGQFGEAFMVFSPFLEQSPEHPLIKPIGRLPDLDWDALLLRNNEPGQRTSRNWATSKKDWTLHIEAGATVDKVVFLVPVTSIIYVRSVSLLHDGIAHYVPFSQIKADGFIHHNDYLWKSDYGPATLTIFPEKPNTGNFKVKIDLGIAPPDVLLNLIRPPIGAMTLTQLESLDTRSAARFHLAQSLLKRWITDA